MDWQSEGEKKKNKWDDSRDKEEANRMVIIGWEKKLQTLYSMNCYYLLFIFEKEIKLNMFYYSYVLGTTNTLFFQVNSSHSE